MDEAKLKKANLLKSAIDKLTVISRAEEICLEAAYDTGKIGQNGVTSVILRSDNGENGSSFLSQIKRLASERAKGRV